MLEPPVPEVRFSPNVAPTTLTMEVHAVHYTEDNDFGVLIRTWGDNSLIIDEGDGSINLFLSPDSFRNLVKMLVEVLVFRPEGVSENEPVEEAEEEATTLGPDDSEGL